MATYNMDIREIRNTVFGRDMREPIADALLQLKDRGIDIDIKRIDSVETVLNENIIDDIYLSPRIIHEDYRAESQNDTGLEIDLISGDDYLLTDNKQTDDVVLIEDSDYRLNLGSSAWDSEETNTGIITVYDVVEVKETYTLVFNL